MVDNSLHIIVKQVSAQLVARESVAMSYVWGDLAETEEVTVEHVYCLPDDIGVATGVCLQHQSNITASLAMILGSTHYWGKSLLVLG